MNLSKNRVPKAFGVITDNQTQFIKASTASELAEQLAKLFSFPELGYVFSPDAIHDEAHRVFSGQVVYLAQMNKVLLPSGISGIPSGVQE